MGGMGNYIGGDIIERILVIEFDDWYSAVLDKIMIIKRLPDFENFCLGEKIRGIM